MICEKCGHEREAGFHCSPCLSAENAKLRVELSEAHACLGRETRRLIQERDAALLQLREEGEHHARWQALCEHYMLVFEEWKKALEEIYKLEGPGLDGSPENASGSIARIALERFAQKRKDEAPHAVRCECPECKRRYA